MQEVNKKNQVAEEKTPRWLKTIQLNSWEAELLISALVLYALFQIPDYLDQLSLRYFARGSRMIQLFNLIEDAIRLLSLGYILHILVRGVWVASVGLSYVFPKGVDQEALKFKGNFKKELTTGGSLVKMVLQLEQLSSIIYGVSFIFFGTLLGFGAFVFSLLGFFELLLPAMNSNTYLASTVGILILFYFLLTTLVFIDFLTNGLFRRKNWSADWFYVVARIFRVITLSFLYRRSLLVLISNTKGWKSYLIPFIVLGVSGGYMQLTNIQEDNIRDTYYKNSVLGDYTPINYENTRNTNDYIIATIQSDIVQEGTLKVYLRDIGAFGGTYFFDSKKGVKGKWDQLTSDSISMYFDKRLKVEIDDKRIENITWFKTQHPTTYKFGFTAFIDILSLDRGSHFLKIGIDTMNMNSQAIGIVEQDEYSLQTISKIFFVYEKP